MAPDTIRSIKPIETIRFGKDDRQISRRKKCRIRFYAPINEILERLKAQKFLKMGATTDTKRSLMRKKTSSTERSPLIINGSSKSTLRGTFRGNLVNLDHQDIIRYYNAILTGIYNYYVLSINRKAMGRIF